MNLIVQTIFADYLKNFPLELIGMEVKTYKYIQATRLSSLIISVLLRPDLNTSGRETTIFYTTSTYVLV